MKGALTGRRAPRHATTPPTLRVYGDSERFRGLVTRQIASGENLLDELEGVRKSATRLPKKRGPADVEREAVTLIGYHRLWQWRERVGRWRVNAVVAAERQLADQTEALLPHISKALPVPATGLRADDTPRVESWLREAVEELRRLRASLGVRRNVATASSAGFEELRASGLIDAVIIDGWVKDVANPHTPKQVADAIGAAKEIAEASLRAGLDRLHISWTDRDDVSQLMRKWRDAARASGLDAAGAQQLDQALAALGNLVAFLSGFRNAYGRGHGRTRYAAGIRPRHARLAVDIADAVARFVVLTMDDLAQLPPRGRTAQSAKATLPRNRRATPTAAAPMPDGVVDASR
jgi:hypothetical protein